MRPTTIGLMLLLLTSLAAATETAPRRVVSLNLCSDQLLLLLADPPQVASVSHLSTEPASSFVAEQAALYPLNRARAEEVIRLQPDLILVTPHTNPRLRTTLEQLGYPLHRLSLGNRLEDIISDIRKLAARLGQVSRGEALIARMRRRLQSALPDSGKPSPTAIFYQPRGYTSGSNTLQDEALRLAGWNNLAARHGVEGYAPVPLEELLLWQPATLFTSSYAPTGDSLAERQLRHPALKRLLVQRPLREIPYRYWICPGPMLAEAVELLREIRVRSDQ